MGVFIIRSRLTNKCFIETARDFRGKINGARVRLRAGMHPNRELQKAWQEHGEENFVIEILENLEYDQDESKTDYTEDLALLKMIWEEKLTGQGLEFYRKRI
jgi:hypothetical protein